MRRDVYHYLKANEELRAYVRRHPIWYRKLSRRPSLLYQLEREADYFYGRTLPQRVEQLQNHLHLALMFIEMMKIGQETMTDV